MDLGLRALLLELEIQDELGIHASLEDIKVKAANLSRDEISKLLKSESPGTRAEGASRLFEIAIAENILLSRKDQGF